MKICGLVLAAALPAGFVCAETVSLLPPSLGFSEYYVPPVVEGLYASAYRNCAWNNRKVTFAAALNVPENAFRGARAWLCFTDRWGKTRKFAADAFDRIGLPEGHYPLAHAALYCATAPKSNSSMAFFDALASVEKEDAEDDSEDEDINPTIEEEIEDGDNKD